MSLGQHALETQRLWLIDRRARSSANSLACNARHFLATRRNYRRGRKCCCLASQTVLQSRAHTRGHAAPPSCPCAAQLLTQRQCPTSTAQDPSFVSTDRMKCNSLKTDIPVPKPLGASHRGCLRLRLPSHVAPAATPGDRLARATPPEHSFLSIAQPDAPIGAQCQGWLCSWLMHQGLLRGRRRGGASDADVNRRSLVRRQSRSLGLISDDGAAVVLPVLKI